MKQFSLLGPEKIETHLWQLVDDSGDQEMALKLPFPSGNHPNWKSVPTISTMFKRETQM